MTFTTLPKLAAYIRRNHYSFAGRFVRETLSVLGELNANCINSAMIGATFTAWQYIEGYGHLKTEIYIEKSDRYGWIYSEKTA